ncbi:MAG TPA: EamA family transporter [Mycobacteriales bacterium]|jgi:drug/metabolite transporter (DMT)-like permease|nr:EamA family transporter [Mycobacteriales bacterium]
MASRYRVWAALVTVYVVWGSTYLAIRYAIGADTGQRGLPPLLMGGTRFFLAGLLMFAVTVRRPHPDGEPDPLGRRQWLACAVVGTTLLLGGNGLVTLAERSVPSGIAAVIVALVPVWTALFGLLLGGERLRRRGVVGLAIGFAGAFVLGNPAGAGHFPPGGMLMLACATLSWSAGSYYAHSAPVPRRPLVMTGMEMLCGGAAMTLVALARGEAGDLRLGTVGWSAWVAYAYLVVFGSMLAFTAYVWLLRNARLSLVTTYAYVNPAVAVLLGALFLSERLTPRALVASALILAGVGLVVSSRPQPKPVEEQPCPAVGAMVEVAD